MLELSKEDSALLRCLNIHDQEISRHKEAVNEIEMELSPWCLYERQIKRFIEERQWSQSVKAIVKGWKEKYINNYYISCTTEIVVSEFYKECKYLYENGYLD